MRAAILAVGSELLSVDRLDTNSLQLTELLERHGVELVRKVVVGDDEVAIAGEIARLLAESDLLVVGGGLGPTADDVTREACARALGLPLRDDPEAWAAIERRFAALARAPSENNRRQAQVVAGAALLPNPRGTAPGQRIDTPRGTIFLLPGVPFELESMAAEQLEPWLAARSSGRGRERRTLKVAMRPESEVDEAIAPLYEEFGRRWITVLSGAGEIRVRLWAEGASAERGARLAEMERRARELLGEAVFGAGDATTLEEVVAEGLVGRGASIATAESCTGGLVAERLTRVAGSSRYFPGGVVTYSNAQKTALLGVPEALLAAHGAVSEPVARAMAEGVRARFSSTLGLGVTGIAGPDGGSPEKPVGTVHLALAGADRATAHRLVRLPGDRSRIRWLASQAALELLRRSLRSSAGAAP